MNSLAKYFENKIIGILGFGKEGKSTYQYIRKYYQDAKVYIFEDKNPELKDPYIEVFPFQNWGNCNIAIDLFMKSPGLPWSEAFKNTKTKITSQVELFMDFAKGRKVGITGSAGKTSTTSFTFELLKQNQKLAFIGGNFGIPLFDFIDELDERSITVMELSSYQLKPLKKNPEISIFLNIYPDHLDYHKTFQDYFDSKCNIYKYQNKTDLLITDYELLASLPNISSEVQTISRLESSANIFIEANQIKFKNGEVYSLKDFQPRGYGYRSNLGAAIAATRAIGLSQKEIIKIIPSLITPPHRLENLGQCQNVQFYNDSISTIPETALHAIRSISEANGIIVGGFDRGLHQELLVNELRNNQQFLKIICMGETGRKIYATLKNELGEKIFLTDALQEAVEIIIKTPNMKCCLFSPAAPSFGLYRNFEERGDRLRETLNKLNQTDKMDKSRHH
jgi:UDP-N-acetylmuramoylalanine--D-glutamate ligase